MLIEPATPSNFPEIVDVWEASVRTTHDFLSETDIQDLKPLILNEYLKAVDLFVVREDEKILGFLGLSSNKIEMLFIRPDVRGNGIGKKLIRFAMDEKGFRKVDVNEQNPQAVWFYRHMGFEVVSRSPLDPQGKPFPILSMELKNNVIHTLSTTFRRGNLTFSYIAADDLADIVPMLTKESVCRYLSFGPNTEQDTRNYFEPLIESIRSSLEKNELPNEHVFTIREENGAFVGQCALLPVPFSLDNYTVAFTIDDSHWGHGYGEQACRFLIDYAFHTLKATRLSGDCFDKNEGSRRIMEKCGFELEGRQRRYWQKNGEVYDNLLFGLSKDDLAFSPDM